MPELHLAKLASQPHVLFESVCACKRVASEKLPLQVHRNIPAWLYFAIKNRSWDANPLHEGQQCSLIIYLYDAHTGRQVHAQLDRARQTRDLVVQMNQV